MGFFTPLAKNSPLNGFLYKEFGNFYVKTMTKPCVWEGKNVFQNLRILYAFIKTLLSDKFVKNLFLKIKIKGQEEACNLYLCPIFSEGKGGNRDRDVSPVFQGGKSSLGRHAY